MTTGLQNNLHRWYDASVGSWINEDPIGFEGGDANLYRYCGNDPVNAADSGEYGSDDDNRSEAPSKRGYHGGHREHRGRGRKVEIGRSERGGTVDGVNTIEVTVFDFFLELEDVLAFRAAAKAPPR